MLRLTNLIQISTKFRRARNNHQTTDASTVLANLQKPWHLSWKTIIYLPSYASIAVVDVENTNSLSMASLFWFIIVLMFPFAQILIRTNPFLTQHCLLRKKAPIIR